MGVEGKRTDPSGSTQGSPEKPSHALILPGISGTNLPFPVSHSASPTITLPPCGVFGTGPQASSLGLDTPSAEDPAGSRELLSS